MANHASALKRIRSNEKKRQRNRYQHKTAKTLVKKFLKIDDREVAQQKLGEVISMLDKLAKKKIIHPNKSGRKKAQVARHLNSRP